MICSVCNKERKKGKVENGQFICQLCIADAKKDKDKKAIINKVLELHKALERAERIVYVARYNMEELIKVLSDHGIHYETQEGLPELVEK